MSTNDTEWPVNPKGGTSIPDGALTDPPPMPPHDPLPSIPEYSTGQIVEAVAIGVAAGAAVAVAPAAAAAAAAAATVTFLHMSATGTPKMLAADDGGTHNTLPPKLSGEPPAS